MVTGLCSLCLGHYHPSPGQRSISGLNQPLFSISSFLKPFFTVVKKGVAKQSSAGGNRAVCQIKAYASNMKSNVGREKVEIKCGRKPCPYDGPLYHNKGILTLATALHTDRKHTTSSRLSVHRRPPHYKSSTTSLISSNI